MPGGAVLRVSNSDHLGSLRDFDGLELVEPGVVPCPLWRPSSTEVGTPRGMDQYGGVARKP